MNDLGIRGTNIPPQGTKSKDSYPEDFTKYGFGIRSDERVSITGIRLDFIYQVGDPFSFT